MAEREVASEPEISIQRIDPIVPTADEITLASNGFSFVWMMSREEFEAEFGVAAP